MTDGLIILEFYNVFARLRVRFMTG